MRTTIALRNVVCETQHFFVVSVRPLKRYFNTDAIILLTVKMKDLIDAVFACIDIADKLEQTTFMLKLVTLINALIGQNDAHTRVKERKLT